MTGIEKCPACGAFRVAGQSCEKCGYPFDKDPAESDRRILDYTKNVHTMVMGAFNGAQTEWQSDETT